MTAGSRPIWLDVHVCVCVQKFHMNKRFDPTHCGVCSKPVPIARLHCACGGGEGKTKPLVVLFFAVGPLTYVFRPGLPNHVANRAGGIDQDPWVH